MVVKGVTRKRKGVISLVKRSTKLERFGLDDLAQQVVGAFILSAPFSVTEEVWNLANNLSFFRVVILIFFTVFVSTLIIYYTKFQRVAKEDIGKPYVHIPKRLVSLFIVSYSCAFFVLWLFGVIGYITDPYWIFKLVVFVSFFSSLGAATADILK
jgi:uncharacterized membrane protein